LCKAVEFMPREQQSTTGAAPEYAQFTAADGLADAAGRLVAEVGRGLLAGKELLDVRWQWL
jgi:hypothetical protein